MEHMPVPPLPLSQVYNFNSLVLINVEEKLGITVIEVGIVTVNIDPVPHPVFSDIDLHHGLSLASIATEIFLKSLVPGWYHLDHQGTLSVYRFRDRRVEGKAGLVHAQQRQRAYGGQLFV